MRKKYNTPHRCHVVKTRLSDEEHADFMERLSAYPIDKNAQEQTTEEGLITYLLDRETTHGGWTLSGDEPDSDITGMTIQALSPYYGIRSDVTGAIDRALDWLSSSQLQSGGYGTMGTETSESVAQIIVALCSIGIDGAKDSRFIKNGKWPMTGLFQYYLPEGGFMHVAAGADNNGGGEPGALNGMATEQGMYATVAYKRLLEGKTYLYDMSDFILIPGVVGTGAVKPPAAQTPGGAAGTGTTAARNVKVTNVKLDYSQISLEKGKTRTLTVTVTPSNATNQAVTWKSSNKKIATVTKKGKVKGIKAGTATITAIAADGSGKKASCTVKVTKAVSATTAASSKNTTSSSGAAAGTTRSRTTTAATVAASKSAAGGQAGGSASNSNSGNASGSQTAGAAGGTTAADSGGWSFGGADYVPESYDTGEEVEGGESPEGEESSGSWMDKSITIRIPVGPVFFTLAGAFGLALLELIFWFARKKGLWGKIKKLIRRERQAE